MPGFMAEPARWIGHFDMLALSSRSEQAPIAVIEVPNQTDCVVRFQRGEADAIRSDDTVLAGFAVQDPFSKVVGRALTEEPYGMATSLTHPEFTRFVNAVLAKAKADTGPTGWRASYDRWLAPALGEPLATLDRFEEVGGAPVVEPEEGADRRLEVGVAGRAEQDGIRATREALHLGETERIHERHPGDLPAVPARVPAHRAGKRKRPLVPRDERPSLPRCHPDSAMPLSRDRRAGCPAERRCPVSLALCAGAY